MDSGTENDPKLKLFLRLPRDTFAPTPEDEEFLKQELFRLLGETSADRFMPRISKGHCFLFFATRLLAAEAHDKLSNKVVKDYPLQPVFGFTREEQQAVDAGLQNKEIERNHRTLYIRGLPQQITDDQLEARFSQFGEIEKTNIVATKASKVAFLVYRKFAPAHQAIEAYTAGLEMNGVMATVELSKNKNLRRRVEKFQQGGMRGGGFGGPRGFHRGGWGGGRGGGFGGRGGYPQQGWQTPAWSQPTPQWGSQRGGWGSRGGGYGAGGFGGRGGRGRGAGAPRGRGGAQGGAYGRTPQRGAYQQRPQPYQSGGAYGAGATASAGGAYGARGAYGGRGGAGGAYGARGGGMGGGRGAATGGWGGNKSFTPY